MRSLHRYTLVGLFLLVLLPASAFAQAGKIAGTVTDEAGLPLPGVNVVIVEDGEPTTRGTVTDENGYYVILNVAPGLYGLQASFIGFATVTKTDVRVNIDLTTTVDFALPEATGELDEIVVESEEPVVKQDVAGQVTNLSREEINSLPISRLESLIGIQAGADGLSIRGGEVRELGMNVNGISMRSPREHSPFVNVSFSAIEDVQLQTGGFNAEYGNIRSGNVNVLMIKPPRDYFLFEGFVRYVPAGAMKFNQLGYRPDDPNAYFVRPWNDDPNLPNDVDPAYVGTEESAWDEYTRRQYPEFRGWEIVAEELREDENPNNDLTVDQLMNEYMPYIRRKNLEITKPRYDVDFTVGGPLTPGDALGDLRFTASYRREQNPMRNPLRRDVASNDVIQGQVVTDLAQNIQLNLLGLHSWTSEQEDEGFYERTSVWALDNTSLLDEKYWMFGGKLTHSLSSRTFYEVSLSRFSDYYRTTRPPARDTTTVFTIPTEGGTLRLDEQPFGWAPQIEQAYGNLMQTSAAWWATYYDTSRSAVWNLDADLTSQLNQYVQLKTGASLLVHNYDMSYGESNPIEVFPEMTYQRWEAHPILGGAFAQTKIEFKGMIANVGLRLDYFNAGGDWYDFPAFSGALGPGNADPNAMDYTDLDSLARVREDFSKEMPKSLLALSPRLGVSFPVTTKSKIYFNYGQMRQVGIAQTMFEVSRQLNGAILTIGNPENPFPVTTSYELGYERSFFDMVRFALSGYYRDTQNEALEVFYTGINEDIGYFRTAPLGYSDTRGVEITFDKYGGDWVRGFFNFTYMQQKGGDFGFGEVFQNLVQQREFLRTATVEVESPVPVPNASFSMTFLSPDGFGPEIAGVHPVANWRLSFLGSWARPAPFTWVGLQGDQVLGSNPAFRNNVREKDFWNLDMRLGKTFSAGIGEVNFFVDIQNPFNIKRLIALPMEEQNGGYLGERDWEWYMQSLHLPEDTFEGLASDPYVFIPGNDQPGDYRDPDVEYQPVEAVATLPESPEENTERAWRWARDQGDYFQWQDGSWVEVPEDEVDRALDSRAYIDMPNARWDWFLNPRRVVFGLSLSF